MAAELDEAVAAFRTRSLDARPVHVCGRRRLGAQGPRDFEELLVLRGAHRSRRVASLARVGCLARYSFSGSAP